MNLKLLYKLDNQYRNKTHPFVTLPFLYFLSWASYMNDLSSPSIIYSFPLSLALVVTSFIQIKFTYNTIHPFKVYHSVVFSVFTEVCNHHYNKFQDVPSPQDRHRSMSRHIPFHMCHHHLQSTNLLSVSMDLPILDIFM